MVGSTALSACDHRFASAAYWSADIWPSCHGPYTAVGQLVLEPTRSMCPLSLPKPQYLTLWGSSRPVFLRRMLAQVVFPVPLQYSSQASASSRVPVPTASEPCLTYSS